MTLDLEKQTSVLTLTKVEGMLDKSPQRPGHVTGYDTNLRYYAARYTQGGRIVYALDLSLSDIQALVPRPDPSTPTPGNRALRPAHAQSFAKYIREHEGWVVPALILRTPVPFGFEATDTVEGLGIGVVSFPRQRASDIHILDGQHRILGIHLADHAIVQDLDKARDVLVAARRQDPNGTAERDAQRHIAMLNRQRDRMSRERISVQIFVEDDAAAFKQMFFDIADNALGITSSVKARFDTHKVVNRALDEVLQHPLLVGRVDLEKDYLGAQSPYLVGAKHVAEMIRCAQVGLEGRVSRRQDLEWKESDVAKNAIVFLDLASAAFPQFASVSNGQLAPLLLRKSSLLGSVLMLRILASVYSELKAQHAFTNEMVHDFFETLAPHMAAPIGQDSIWIAQFSRPIFAVGSMAPQSRRQDQQLLKDTLLEWAITRPPFLNETQA